MAITEPNKGRTTPLRRHHLVQRATAILDDYGIADLTMRRLARELDIAPSALYWHFDSKQQLLGAVADHLLTPAPIVDNSASSWDDRIAARCRALRDALLSHKDGAELVSSSFAAGQSEVMAAVLAGLAAGAATAGLEPESAGLAARSLVYYVLGYVTDEQSRMQWDSAGALDEKQSPLSHTFADASAQFGFGVRLIIDGIGQLARQSDTATSAATH